MKKMLLLLSIVLLLAACGAPSEEAIYEDVVAILEEDLPEKGVFIADLSSQTMTQIVDLGDGLYEVNGNFNSMTGRFYSYVMKIKYDGNEWIEYEWVTN